MAKERVLVVANRDPNIGFWNKERHTGACIEMRIENLKVGWAGQICDRPDVPNLKRH